MQNPIAVQDCVLPLAQMRPGVPSGNKKGCSMFVNENDMYKEEQPESRCLYFRLATRIMTEDPTMDVIEEDVAVMTRVWGRPDIPDIIFDICTM